ncbi:MAG: hypothetical protein ACR2F6_05050 [Mycobacteriales bacterium]
MDSAGLSVDVGGRPYHWREDWAQQPTDHSAHVGWAHHGLAVTVAGELLGFHPGEPSLLVFNADGTLARSVRCPVREAHGLTLVMQHDVEYLWIADNGVKPVLQSDGSYRPGQPDTAGQVIEIALDGAVVQRLQTPPLEIYQSAAYSPTSVAIAEERHGGSGDVWVADGYGQSLVHRFSAGGDYLATISGKEGTAGAFSCPHAVFIDRRGEEPELYIADRGNAQVQVYSLDGVFRRSFGNGYLTSPSAFATVGDLLVVAELFAQLALLDAEDQLIGYVGTDPAARDRPGWPNVLNQSGSTAHPPLRPGRFNSPHGIATDRDGAIYVTEWLVGGRLVKLDPSSPEISLKE